MFSCKTVHEKHVSASSACVVERPDSLLAKHNCVGQSRLCLQLVFCSRPIRMINKVAEFKTPPVEQKRECTETDGCRVSTTPFLNFLSSFWTGRQNRRIESTCWVLTCLAVSQFSNVYNVGVVYAGSVKDELIVQDRMSAIGALGYHYQFCFYLEELSNVRYVIISLCYEERRATLSSRL